MQEVLQMPEKFAVGLAAEVAAHVKTEREEGNNGMY